MAPRIDSFLRLAVDQRASDLHFHAGSVPTIRYHGDLLPLPFRTLSGEETRRFLYEVMSAQQRSTFERDLEIDFAYAVGDLGRFRVNVYQQARGVGAVFRVISDRIPTIEELSLPRVLRRLAGLHNGLVLVTGPTGSGKSTTLAAVIHEINRSAKRHIITVEDPIEYLHEPLQSLVTQREIGQHTESYTSALRAALRESPDVLVVGELRDVETVALALSAAETGTLVFGTLHTNSAAKAVDRVIDMCSDEAQAGIRTELSLLLRGVVAQDLVKRSGGESMVAAVEVLLPTVALSHMIREGKTYQIDAYIQQSEGDGSGMVSKDSALARLVGRGLVELGDALPLAQNPDLLRRAAAQMLED